MNCCGVYLSNCLGLYLLVIVWCSLQTITFLEFHPNIPILASGSEDRTVKLFDFSKSAAKKAYKSIEVSNNYNSCFFYI